MNERPLPVFGPGLDPGPSFVELLRRTAPTRRRGRRRLQAASTLLSTSRTARRSSPSASPTASCWPATGAPPADYAIANRRIEKVFPADDLSGVAIAGVAGPGIDMVRLFQTQLEHYEKIEGEPLSLEGKANQLAQMVRANLPAALQGLIVVPLFAGFDERRGRGRVFSFDATGGKYEEADFQANGSGGVHAKNWIKATWREGMTADETIDLAVRSLFAAADEDAATGGPDLVRRIFPTVAVIDADGYRSLADDDVARRATALLGGAEEGAGE